MLLNPCKVEKYILKSLVDDQTVIWSKPCFYLEEGKEIKNQTPSFCT